MRTLVYYLLNHVDFAVDLFYFERRHHLSSFDRQYVFKFVQQDVGLDYVKEGDISGLAGLS